MECKAFVKRELLDGGYIIPTTINLTREECEHCLFEHYTFDGGVSDFEERYNMVLVHPISGKLFFAYSIDFDFTNNTKE